MTQKQNGIQSNTSQQTVAKASPFAGLRNDASTKMQMSMANNMSMSGAPKFSPSPAFNRFAGSMASQNVGRNAQPYMML